MSIGNSRERHRKHHEGHSKELEESERGENVGCVLRMPSSGVGDESENGGEGRETVKQRTTELVKGRGEGKNGRNSRHGDTSSSGTRNEQVSNLSHLLRSISL